MEHRRAESPLGPSAERARGRSPIPGVAAIAVVLLAGAPAAGGAGPHRGAAVPGARTGPTRIAEAAGDVRPAVVVAAARLRASPEQGRLNLLRQLAPQMPGPLSAPEIAEMAAALPESARLDALNALQSAVPPRLDAAEMRRIVAGLPDRDRPAALRLLAPRAERLGPAEAAALLGPLRGQQRLDGLNAVCGSAWKKGSSALLVQAEQCEGCDPAGNEADSKPARRLP